MAIPEAGGRPGVSERPEAAIKLQTRAKCDPAGVGSGRGAGAAPGAAGPSPAAAGERSSGRCRRTGAICGRAEAARAPLRRSGAAPCWGGRGQGHPLGLTAAARPAAAPGSCHSLHVPRARAAPPRVARGGRLARTDGMGASVLR